MKHSGSGKILCISLALLLPLGLTFLVSCETGGTFARQGGGFGNAPDQEGGATLERDLKLSQGERIFRKNNLEHLAIGRNRIEIQQLMGPPDGRSLDGGNGYLWDYRRPIYDEASDTVYAWSLVSFKFLKGLCAYVNVRLEHPPVQLTEGEPALEPGQ